MKRSRESIASEDEQFSRKKMPCVPQAWLDLYASYVPTLNEQFASVVTKLTKENAAMPLQGVLYSFLDASATLKRRYMLTSGQVYTCGNGDCGQLGHGNENDEAQNVSVPMLVKAIENKKIVSVASGGLHCVVLTEDGQVYTWGCNDDGALGRTTGDDGEDLFPEPVEGMEGQFVVRIAAGGSHVLAVTDKGEVWGWGAYRDKEGKKFFNAVDGDFKTVKRQQNTPMRIAGLENIVDVACCSSSNVALTATGEVLSWGVGEVGELARYVPDLKFPAVGDDEPKYDLQSMHNYRLTPAPMLISSATKVSAEEDKKAKAITGVTAIGCGSYHCMLATVANRVFVVGLNNYGQLGLSNETAAEYLTEVVSLRGKSVQMITGGEHHSLLMTSTGQVWTFGRADSGQLGVGNSYEGKDLSRPGSFVNTPVKVEFPSDIRAVEITAGDHHNLVCTAGGEVYAWGFGDMGALGLGKDADQFAPMKLNKAPKDVKQIAAGGQHSILLA